MMGHDSESSDGPQPVDSPDVGTCNPSYRRHPAPSVGGRCRCAVEAAPTGRRHRQEWPSDGPLRVPRTRSTGFDLRSRVHGPRRVRAASAHESGTGRRRHQGLSHDRPVTMVVEGRVALVARHRRGRCHAPEHRLPLADGPVVLDVRPTRCAHVGRPAVVARHDHVRRRSRHLVVVPSIPRSTHRHRRRVLLHAVAVRPAVQRTDVGHVAAVGRSALADRSHRDGSSATIVEGTRTVRAPARHDRRHQRNVVGPRGVRTRVVAHLHRRPSAQLRIRQRDAARASHTIGRRGGAHRRAVGVDSGMVDGRATQPGRVRTPDPQVHRDLPDGRQLLLGSRSPSRTRTLVLLRRRPARCVGPALGHLYRTTVGHWAQLPHSGARVDRTRDRPRPPSRLLRITRSEPIPSTHPRCSVESSRP
jgi:hypothetical protein